jgi:hypothetical protein
MKVKKGQTVKGGAGDGSGKQRFGRFRRGDLSITFIDCIYRWQPSTEFIGGRAILF